MNYSEQLIKVMQPEIYKGYPLRQIGINKWQFGIKTFDSKEDLKKFIDSFTEIKK